MALLEVEFFNSFWEKRVKSIQPDEQWGALGTIPLRGVGSSASLGVWPLNNIYAAPQTYKPTTSNAVAIPFQDSVKDFNFYLEESRIRGGFNDMPTDLGARAYLDEDEPLQQHRFNALIYSGLFNSRTGINKTNEFPVGTSITKAANPEYGTIQKLYAEETNLVVLQENKCSRALIDKDTIYTTEGGTQTMPRGTVIGQITPYAGEYGISKNPESFAIYSYRKYFADRNRNAILRLSHDGITEVSEYGMRDWFRDNLATLNDDYTNTFTYPFTVTVPVGPIFQSYLDYAPPSPDLLKNNLIGTELAIETAPGVFTNQGIYVTSITNDKIYFSGEGVSVGSMSSGAIKLISYNRSYVMGGWDVYNKQYVASLQYNNSVEYNGVDTGKDNTYYTVGFDEAINGWPSFYNYRPTLIGSSKNKFYSINNFYDTWNFTGIGSFGFYEQFKDNVTNTNRGVFYGTSYPSTVTIIANQGPSIEKNFLTIDYEGSNGWKAAHTTDSMESDETGEDFYSGIWQERVDSAGIVHSYDEGSYVDANTGYTLRAGFDRKENRYVANLINNTAVAPAEVLFGAQMSGIKGYYVIATLATDTTTAPGRMKELYQVGLNYNISST